MHSLSLWQNRWVYKLLHTQGHSVMLLKSRGISVEDMIEEDLTTGCWRTLTSPPPPQPVIAAGKVAVLPSQPLERHARGRGAKLASPCHPPPPVPTSTIIFFTPGGGNRKKLWETSTNYWLLTDAYKIRRWHWFSASCKQSKTQPANLK